MWIRIATELFTRIRKLNHNEQPFRKDTESMIKSAKNGKDFMDNAKKYFANMNGNQKTLHIKGAGGCQWSTFAYEYVDFDTLEEAEQFSPRLSKCEDCFRDQ